MAAHGSRHSAYRPRGEAPPTISTRSPRQHAEKPKPPRCTAKAHRWQLDSASVGTCQECGQTWQFGSGYAVSFRDSAVDVVAPREFYGLWVER